MTYSIDPLQHHCLLVVRHLSATVLCMGNRLVHRLNACIYIYLHTILAHSETFQCDDILPCYAAAHQCARAGARATRASVATMVARGTLPLAATGLPGLHGRGLGQIPRWKRTSRVRSARLLKYSASPCYVVAQWLCVQCEMNVVRGLARIGNMLSTNGYINEIHIQSCK